MNLQTAIYQKTIPAVYYPETTVGNEKNAQAQSNTPDIDNSEKNGQDIIEEKKEKVKTRPPVDSNTPQTLPENVTKKPKSIQLDTDLIYVPDDPSCGVVELWSDHHPKGVLYAKFCEKELEAAFIKEKHPLEELQNLKTNFFKGHIVGPINETGFKYSKKEGTAPYFFKLKDPDSKIRGWLRLDKTYIDPETGKHRDVWAMDKVSFTK